MNKDQTVESKIKKNIDWTLKKLLERRTDKKMPGIDRTDGVDIYWGNYQWYMILSQVKTHY